MTLLEKSVVFYVLIDIWNMSFCILKVYREFKIVFYILIPHKPSKLEEL